MGFWLELELQDYDTNGDVLKMFLPEDQYKYEENKNGAYEFIEVSEYNTKLPFPEKRRIMAIDAEWYNSKFSYEGL